jgi:hypothetical protein
MKKLICFLMILALGAGIHVNASKPIPSFKEKIYNVANFQEKNQGGNAPMSGDLKGKRAMIIVANVVGPAKTPVIIWVYSLDLTSILGPFVIFGDGQISVPVDDRNWGTVVQCTDKVEVSVYSEDQGGLNFGEENL